MAPMPTAMPPIFLAETKHAERAARRVADENRDQDVQRLERPHLFDNEADPERHNDL